VALRGGKRGRLVGRSPAWSFTVTLHPLKFTKLCSISHITMKLSSQKGATPSKFDLLSDLYDLV